MHFNSVLVLNIHIPPCLHPYARVATGDLVAQGSRPHLGPRTHDRSLRHIRCHFTRISSASLLQAVAKRVGAGAPPGQEEGQADSLEDAGQGADGNGVKRALLGRDLGDELR